MTSLIYLYENLKNNYQSRRLQNVSSVKIRENIDRPRPKSRDIVLFEEFLPSGNHLDTIDTILKY